MGNISVSRDVKSHAGLQVRGVVGGTGDPEEREYNVRRAEPAFLFFFPFSSDGPDRR